MTDIHDKNVVLDNTKNKLKTYIIYEYDNNGCDSNQYELARMQAENFDEAIKIVKDDWINHSWIKANHQTLEENDFYPYYDLGSTTYYDLDGKQIETPEDFDECKHSYFEEGIRIEEVGTDFDNSEVDE